MTSNRPKWQVREILPLGELMHLLLEASVPLPLELRANLLAVFRDAYLQTCRPVKEVQLSKRSNHQSTGKSFIRISSCIRVTHAPLMLPILRHAGTRLAAATTCQPWLPGSSLS